MHTQLKYPIRRRPMPITNRGIADYQRELGINVKTLKGKSVLDIGAGYGIFQEECQKIGIPAIALDPSYRNPTKGGDRFESHLKIARSRKGKVSGVNETLPFKENSFDMVLSNCSSFHYLYHNYPRPGHRYEMAKLMFEEVVRVLKPGGEARIGEVRQRSNDRNFYHELLEEVAEKYYSGISWEFVTVVIPWGTEGKKKFRFEEYLILHKLAENVH